VAPVMTLRVSQIIYMCFYRVFTFLSFNVLFFIFITVRLATLHVALVRSP
jgi:hypothetical protein